jgi:phosphoribosylformimino-5-aminoimidazole carboxamide ribotide isomerase
MRILAVLDLLGGVVVRGVAGRREEYRPIRSRLVDSSQPLAVACAFRDQLGLDELYLADLDAILGRAPDLATCSLLREAGFRLWVDAGIRQADEARTLVNAGVAGVVVGLETLSGPQALAEIAAEHGDRVLFSLDLRHGMPLGDRAAWDHADAWTIAGRAVELGVRRLLVLDLAQVGVNAGTGTEDLCARLQRLFPDLELVAGGGVRGMDDLRRLRACGVSTVLLATVLHDGRITRPDLLVLRNSET